MSKISTDTATAGDHDTPNNDPAERLARHRPFLTAQAKRAIGRTGIGAMSISDLVQKTMLAALQAEQKVKSPARTEKREAVWLWKILQNNVNEAYRRAKAIKHGGGITIGHLEDDEFPGHGTSPSAKFRKATREESLDRAMDSLDPEDREVLTLTFVEGMSNKDIAKRLDVCDRQVRNRYNKALERLRAAYIAIEGPSDTF